jgi:hypothetical protein
MIRFESLPTNVQALVLAKLGWEIALEGCANLPNLANKRRQEVAMVWRDICRKSGQGICTIPAEALKM